MDEPTVVDERSTFEQSVLLRLDELSRQIERVLTLACPVCGPALVAEIHPAGPIGPDSVIAVGDALKALPANGKANGR